MKKLLVVFGLILILSINFTSQETTSNDVSLSETSGEFQMIQLSNKVLPGI